MLYLSDDDWIKISPTVLHSNDKIALGESIYNIMKSICSKLKFSSQVVLSIAMIYFHKFYFYSNFQIEKGTNRLFLCSAFIFIATKVANRLISLNEISNIIKDILTKKNLSFSKDDIKQNIIHYEFSIMSILGFNLEVDLPYSFLVKAKRFFEENLQLNTKKVIELCCYYINDSFILPLCLHYIPDVIAISAVSIMAKQIGIKLNIEKIIALSDFVISNDLVNECEMAIMGLYTRKNDENNKRGEINNNNKESNSTSINSNIEANQCIV